MTSGDYSRPSTFGSLKKGYLKYAGHSSFKHTQHSKVKVMKYCTLAFTPIHVTSHNIFVHPDQTILKKLHRVVTCYGVVMPHSSVLGVSGLPRENYGSTVLTPSPPFEKSTKQQCNVEEMFNWVHLFPLCTYRGFTFFISDEMQYITKF